jgi:hypothetical protein
VFLILKENVVLKNELRYFFAGYCPDFLLAIISFFLLKQEKQFLFFPISESVFQNRRKSFFNELCYFLLAFWSPCFLQMADKFVALLVLN